MKSFFVKLGALIAGFFGLVWLIISNHELRKRSKQLENDKKLSDKYEKIKEKHRNDNRSDDDVLRNGG